MSITSHHSLNVEFIELVPSDIGTLNSIETLYTFDFRAISENMEYDIPAMFKYENILPWVLDDQLVVVNDLAASVPYINKNHYLKIYRDKDSRRSVYARLRSVEIPEFIRRLYVGIPHPDADNFAKDLNLEINYSYQDFLKFNDKIAQKRAFGSRTPKWSMLQNTSREKEYLSKYIKRQFGSGGYTVFAPNEINNPQDVLDTEYSWFAEDVCHGTSASIQIYKDGNLMQVFGYSEQIIESGKFFSGAKLHRISDIAESQRNQITDILKSCTELLDGYTGFLGMDFIISSSGEIYALELNVRMTAVTIPTLIFNTRKYSRIVFLEDQSNAGIGDILFAISPDQAVDILRDIS